MDTYFDWNDEKNELLKAERDMCFEQVLLHIDNGDLLDIIPHPNSTKYPNQKILIVKMNDYVYLVPFVEDGQTYFLKTIIPSRKATNDYLGGDT